MKIMPKNPFVFFSPFLGMYVLVIVLFQNNAILHDEWRYLFFAENLTKGFYSPSQPLNLWSGPGYPILLLPFVLLQLPLVAIVLMNAVLQYLSVVYVYQSVKVVSDPAKAMFFSVCWGFYFPAYPEMLEILTEPFTNFLVALLCFATLNMLQGSHKMKWTFVAGTTLGLLALTKVIFGYPVYLLLVGYIITGIFFKKNHSVVPIAKMLGIAVCITLPYLSYTYALTGKIFYWGNSGGSSLYSMSSTHPYEYGSWIPNEFSIPYSQSQPDDVIERANKLFQSNHRYIITKLEKADELQKDSIFKAEAIRNISENPKRFMLNWVCNVGRLFFRVPISYYQHDWIPLLFIFPNSIVFTFLLLAVYPSLLLWKKIPPGITVLLLLLVIYLLGTSLLSAYPRQLYVVIPIMLVWFSWVLKRTVRFHINESAT